MRQRIVENLMHVLFFIAACASVLAVVLICLFLFRNGIPAIGEIGITKFLLGQKWKPSNNLYGILPFILGSIYVTAGSIVVGVPTALLLAVFLAFYCPKKLYPIFKTTVNLMAGVPSVVYGFFGLVVIVPLMNELTGHDGSTMLTASILLGIMIMPTVTGVAESALRSVPTSYYEGALALGATHERSVFFTVFPAAKSGIMAGVVLGIGRSIDRRDDGSHHGSGQPDLDAAGAVQGTADDDSEHRNRDGLCDGPAQRGTDCNRSSALCIYPADQSACVCTEEQGNCRVVNRKVW